MKKIFTPRDFFREFTQSKTSSDSNKFLILDNPMHWLAKSIALIEQDLSPGIFIVPFIPLETLELISIRSYKLNSEPR